MNAREITKAIFHLKPNAEFTFKENDYSTIQWHVLDGEAPTIKELEAANEELKKLETEAALDAANKKAAAEAKLAALGLTSEDLKALGLA